jgi:hypothetical protein
MLDFFETKPFNAACVGVVTLATCYQTDMNDWLLIVLPMVLVIGYYLAFRKQAI